MNIFVIFEGDGRIIRKTGRVGGQNHRLTEWFGLEGTLKINQSQPSCMGRDTFHYRLLKATSSLAEDFLMPNLPPYSSVKLAVETQSRPTEAL